MFIKGLGEKVIHRLSTALHLAEWLRTRVFTTSHWPIYSRQHPQDLAPPMYAIVRMYLSSVLRLLKGKSGADVEVRYLALPIRGVVEREPKKPMDLQLIAIGVLSAFLLTGGALSYVSRRDRGPQPPAGLPPVRVPAEQPLPPAAQFLQHPERPAVRPLTPLVLSTPCPTAPAVPAPVAGRRGLTPGHQDAEAVREALRANQLAMQDPRQSTLDRVQALMTSPGFALHVADETDRLAGQGRPAEQESLEEDTEKGPPR